MERRKPRYERPQEPPKNEPKRTRCMRSLPHLYDGQFPYFREPKEIGSYSTDSDRQYRDDRSQLQVFTPPRDWNNCSFDLKDGYEKMIRRDENKKEYIDNFLRWVVKHKENFFLQGPGGSNSNQDILFRSLNTDFVCWRGLFTRVMCIPYENLEDLIIAVTRFRGTYFMCEFDTDAKKLQKEQMTPQQAQFFAWGFKFEQYVTADADKGIPDTAVPVNNKANFTSVVRSRLESHSVLFGAEVDCIDRDCKNGNPYVELKTSRLIESQRQHENFCKFKLIKWWAQSFLVGIPRVVCGFRDDDGVVHKLENFPVKDMPGLVQSAVERPWKATICFNFLVEFLRCVKSVVTEDNERVVYVFRSQPRSDVTWEKRVDDPEFSFLPDWFIKWEAWDKPCTV